MNERQGKAATEKQGQTCADVASGTTRAGRERNSTLNVRKKKHTHQPSSSGSSKGEGGIETFSDRRKMSEFVNS